MYPLRGFEGEFYDFTEKFYVNWVAGTPFWIST